ncbi:MAG: hypothetical protein E6F99_23905 [Actinobacteria bacterium]|nr:MAG: hypothetical protein E6F99_23905 [Actinomycetota bacterium]
MSTAARARRSIRGPRRYLPIVLGLALLAAALGAGQGHHRAGGTAGTLAPDRSTSVISAPVDQQPVAAEADGTGVATVPVDVPQAASFRYPRVVVTPARPAGRAPGVDGPRAPPRRDA